MEFKRNIILDYWHTLFRNFNLTQGIWLFYLHSKGFSLFEIAIFEGVFHLTSLLMEIPTGVVADVFGRKLSRVLGIFSYLIYIGIVLYTDNIWFIIGAFVFCGLSYTFESGSGEALVYDSLVLMGKEDDFMRVNGIKEVIFQLSSFVALLIAGLIASVSFDWSFGLTAVMFVFSLLIILMMKETLLERNIERKSMKELLKDQFVTSFQVLFSNKRLLLLIIIGSMMSAPITTIFFYFQNHLDFMGYSISFITVLIGLHAGAAAIGGYYAHKLEKKFGEKLILVFVPIVMVTLFWLILIDSIIFLPFILLGFVESIFYVGLMDYINKIVPSDKRATILSSFGMMFSMIMIVVFTVTGYLGDQVSLKFAFFILAVIISVFYIFLLFVLKGNHLGMNDEISE